MIATGQIALLIVILTTSLLVILREWRILLLLLSIQFIGVFLFISEPWTTGMAMIKLVVGWMACAVLGISHVGGEGPLRESSWPSSRIFRLLSYGLVALIVLSVSPKVILWFPGVSNEQIMGGITLIGGGLLQLGLTGRPFPIIIGLLTILSGFEILYAAVEFSVLVAGLLAGVNLGLALVGAYLLTQPVQQEAV